MTELVDLELKAGVILFEYQREFLEQVRKSPAPLRTCLYYKTGAGKSLAALAAVALLDYHKVVVICPPSTHVQWTALGNRLGIQVEAMSHAKFRQAGTKLSRTMPVIADEFHLFGGQKGKGWRKLDKLAQHLMAPLILASATPNYNDAERCYCVQHILDPHGTKGGYLQFLYTNCTTEQNPFGMEPIVTGFKSYPDAAAYLADMKGVFYLPDDTVFKIVDVLYPATMPDELENFGYNRRDHRMVASQMELRHTQRYQGLVAESGYLHRHVFNELDKIIADSDATLVFANHATVAEAAHRTFNVATINNALITGATTKPLKDRILQEFLAGTYHVLIGTATLATGTDGMDRVCDTLVILDDTDDDALRRQLIGRIMPRGDYVSSVAKRIFRMVPVF
jgi:superfamily II DNA or RNA helicase